MGIFYVLVGLSVIGVAAVFLILKKEEASSPEPLRELNFEENSKESSPSDQKEQKTAGVEGIFTKFGLGRKNAESAPVKSPISISPLTAIFSNLLKKINLGKKVPPGGVSASSQEEMPLSSLKEFLDHQKEAVAGTASVTTSPAMPETVIDNLLSPEEEKEIAAEIDSAAQLSALQEKYDQLDKLFQEKSQALGQVEESLQNELKNRKEFNKLKDILEKELKDTKDKARNVQVELSSTKAEAEGYKKRIEQLEEKVTKLEKILLEKDDEITGLIKRLQTFASPATAATPPQPQQVQEKPVVKPAPPGEEKGQEPQTPSAAEPKPPLREEKKIIEIIEPAVKPPDETEKSDNNQTQGKE